MTSRKVLIWLRQLPEQLRFIAQALRKHTKPFLLDSLWYIRTISPTSVITVAVLIMLTAISSGVSLAIFSGKGAGNQLTINYAEPNRSSSLSFRTKESEFKNGQPITINLNLDTGGAIITQATITVTTDPSLVELNTISAIGSACAQLTVVSLNKATGEATFRCDSINRSLTSQIVGLVTFGVTPKAPVTGYLTLDALKTKLVDTKGRDTYRPSAPFALTIANPEKDAIEELRVPATALNLGMAGCIADTSATIRWLKPVFAKNIEYNWTSTGVPQTPQTPSSSSGNSFPLKKDALHIATIRANNGKGVYGPTSVVRVVSCP